MTTTVRTSWQVMKSSVTALLIRNVQKKFIISVNSSRSLGVFLVFFEPVLHVVIWMIMKSLLSVGKTNGLATPLFILLGATPFLFIRNSLQKSTAIIKTSKDLFNYRQIRPIDPVIALILTELSIGLIVFIAILAAFYWLGIQWHVHDLTFLLANSVSIILFTMGLGITVAMACFFFNVIKTTMIVFMRIFYLLSGIFYSADFLPEQARAVLLYNPVFQFIEIVRMCFNNQTIHQDYTDPIYLFKCGFFFFIFGLGLYIACREKILIEIKQK